MDVDEIAAAVLGFPPFFADAACREYSDRADDWFPERGASTRDAKAVCADCLVRYECLTYAQWERIDFGIWGGLSPLERKVLRRGAC